MSGENQKLKAIGRRLQDEESRFVGYAEIEHKTRELGFGMTVRTLRFYVDEGILPPPKKVGKTPVYEEDWILNVLLSVHLMKSRLNRSLADVRAVLGRLSEDPANLADKLSVLYEETTRDGEGALAPVSRAALVDGFFDLLLGRIGPARQASQVGLAELIDLFRSAARADPAGFPTAQAILRSQGPLEPTPAPSAGPPAVTTAPVGPAPGPSGGVIPPTMIFQVGPPEPAPPAESDRAALPEPTLAMPPGAVTVERARALEETFIGRFESAFERLGRVLCPLDGKGYKAGPRERSLLKRDRAGEIVDVMKRHRVFDRTLLDIIPLDEAREFQVFQRGLFGRGDLKVVVSALCLSPLDQFVKRRWAHGPLGPLEVERAVEGLGLKADVFHYVGVLSTTGWAPECKDRLPSGRNLLVCLIESAGATAWRRHLLPDPRWGGVERAFDPETDREKVERVRDHLRVHLKPKGEFVILENLIEDLDLPAECVRAALDEVLGEDGELAVVVSGGREIVKRRRL